jgi:AraC family transcriptional regulator of adaptative response/methylated-DNA-[protein]-cysteine methyltransferase
MPKNAGLHQALLNSLQEDPQRSLRDTDLRIGQASGRAVIMTRLTTPLGPLLAGATPEGICLVEFMDQQRLPAQLARVQRLLQAHLAPGAPGDSAHLAALAGELESYFQGRLKDFTVPLVVAGTPFQERVWKKLRGIPYGKTLSYQELAGRLGAPTATRAVARANGDNRIAILIPCHRVIGKDGTLVGYGGGLARKRFLLELEERNR